MNNYNNQKFGNLSQADNWLSQSLKLDIINENNIVQEDVECNCGENSISDLEIPTIICLRQKIEFTANLIAFRFMTLNKKSMGKLCQVNDSFVQTSELIDPCPYYKDKVVVKSIKQANTVVESCTIWTDEIETYQKRDLSSLKLLNNCLDDAIKLTNWYVRHSEDLGFINNQYIKNQYSNMKIHDLYLKNYDMSYQLTNKQKENIALSIIGDSVGVFMPGVKLIGLMLIPTEHILATSISFQIGRRFLKLKYERDHGLKHGLILSDLQGVMEIGQSIIGLMSQKIKLLDEFVTKHKSKISFGLVTQVKLKIIRNFINLLNNIKQMTKKLIQRIKSKEDKQSVNYDHHYWSLSQEQLHDSIDQNIIKLGQQVFDENIQFNKNLPVKTNKLIS